MGDRTYFESLPDRCPPDYAADKDLGLVWRFIKGQDPVLEDFMSHAALGKNCPQGVCECRWASCSLVPNENALAIKAKLPRFKRMRAAGFRVPSGSGESHVTGNHIDFWRFSSFEPLRNVCSIK